MKGDTVNLTRAEFLQALDRARQAGRRDALKMLDDRKDAVKCPRCGTVATLDHVKDKDGRCPWCFRFYPVGTKTIAGTAIT